MDFDDDLNSAKPSKTIFGFSVKWMIFFASIILVAVLISYALNWIQAPLDLTSPENIRQMSREANDAWQALEAKKSSISNLESQVNDMTLLYGEDMSKWPQGKDEEYLQLKRQIANLKTAYNSECGQYNAFWLDEWRALPAPDDIPTHCSFLD